MPLHHIIGALDLVPLLNGGGDLWNLAPAYLVAQYADRMPPFLEQAHASHLNLDQYKMWRLSVMLKAAGQINLRASCFSMAKLTLKM